MSVVDRWVMRVGIVTVGSKPYEKFMSTKCPVPECSWYSLPTYTPHQLCMWWNPYRWMSRCHKVKTGSKFNHHCWDKASATPLQNALKKASNTSLIDDLGKLTRGQGSPPAKKDAVPVQNAPRQAPEKKKSAYKAELDRLTREQVIIKEDSHTH